jgi:hypothetical protein
MMRSLAMIFVVLMLSVPGTAGADEFSHRAATTFNPFPLSALAHLTEASAGRLTRKGSEAWIDLFVPNNTPAGVTKVLRDAVRQAAHDRCSGNAVEKILTPIAYKDADDYRPWVGRGSRGAYCAGDQADRPGGVEAVHVPTALESS